ncbi:hypothetical protein SAMN05192575_102411 [Nocardioides alpinus]|uniref:4-amino-4-deoxy-L-arabinose transferase n=1 Tax=Nocardioides alpinus TaxID=748909 RepID=A0A1I0XIW7_9ACTN|nr:hypothetical protein CXG46_02055 [Nocardioides alpinus]SFB00366.1 hypothetical protein SAMN05192575_102411 [Nocardioides alpinus]
MGHIVAGPARRFALPALPWHVVLPVLLYLVVCLAGATQSSIGADELRADPDNPSGVMLGEARSTRSDEFLTASPLALGVTATGQTEDVNPLTASQALLNVLPSGPVTSLLFLDGTALRLGPWLPDSMLFAAKFWLGTLLLLLAAPAWFRTLTLSRWIGWFAATLILLSPANAWWSNTHANLFGFALAGAVSLQKACLEAHHGRWWRAGLWGVVGAALLVRTPLLYPPWALVVVPVILVGTVAALLATAPGRRTAAVVGGVGLLTVVLLAAVYLENSEAIQASGSTVYPGARVVTGSANSVQALFGATNLGILSDGVAVAGSNSSEISSGFTVALLVTLLLLSRGVVWRVPGQRWAVVTMVALTGFWLLWSTVEFGALGERIPLLNQVPSGRSTQILGHLGVVLMCLVLPAARSRGAASWSLLAGGTTAAVGAYAGSFLRLQNLPDLSVAAIWLAALGLGAAVFALTFRPRHVLGYALGGVLALTLVWNVNPLLVGLADLRGSDISQELLAGSPAAREAGDLWVADSYGVDSLMMATGTPALSGRQMSGPAVDVWSRLDPGREHEDVWNRGGSYIWFTWSKDRELTFANPGPDIISITGSPCTVARRMGRLSTVVSSRELDQDCLTPVSSFDWGGSTRWVYDVS